MAVRIFFSFTNKPIGILITCTLIANPLVYVQIVIHPNPMASSHKVSIPGLRCKLLQVLKSGVIGHSNPSMIKDRQGLQIHIVL